MNKDIIRKSLIIPENLKQILLWSDKIPEQAEKIVEQFLEKYWYYDEMISNLINNEWNSILVEYVNEKEKESLKKEIEEIEKIVSKLDNI